MGRLFPMKSEIPNCEQLEDLNPLLKEKSNKFCMEILEVLIDNGFNWDEDNQNFYNMEIIKVISVSRLHELDPEKIRSGMEAIRGYISTHMFRIRLGEIAKSISFILGKLALYSTIILIVLGIFLIPFKTVGLIVGTLIGGKLIFMFLHYLLHSELVKLRQSF